MQSTMTTEYHLELYEGSFRNDPIWSIQSATPLPSISSGQYMMYEGLSQLAWENSPTKQQRIKVVDVEHSFMPVEDILIHKLLVKVEIVDRE